MVATDYSAEIENGEFPIFSIAKCGMLTCSSDCKARFSMAAIEGAQFCSEDGS